jgi:FHA domain-containing protein/uncharacterized protein DUF1707
MGVPAAEAPTTPDGLDGDARPADTPLEPRPPGGVRASDSERDEAIGELKEQFIAGRMSQDTFLYRMNAALEARHQSDLPPLFADLPAPQPVGAWWSDLVGRGRDFWHRHVQPDALSRIRRLTTAMSAARTPQDPARCAVPPARLSFPRGTETYFSIGRDPRCDLAIGDMTVSRVHARLDRTLDGWLLTDLSSTNGTRLNGWLVRGRVAVRAGDIVRFGDAGYVLSGGDED